MIAASHGPCSLRGRGRGSIRLAYFGSLEVGRPCSGNEFLTCFMSPRRRKEEEKLATSISVPKSPALTAGLKWVQGPGLTRNLTLAANYCYSGYHFPLKRLRRWAGRLRPSEPQVGTSLWSKYNGYHTLEYMLHAEMPWFREARS